MTKQQDLTNEYCTTLHKLIEDFTRLRIIDIIDQYYIYQSLSGNYYLRKIK